MTVWVIKDRKLFSRLTHVQFLCQLAIYKIKKKHAGWPVENFGHRCMYIINLGLFLLQACNQSFNISCHIININAL